jgi:hypothetical protein
LNQKNKEGKLLTKIIKTSGNIYQQAMVMKILLTEILPFSGCIFGST